MPIQIGANQFRGKRDGLNGYVVKGKEGAFVRTINPNMSNRVKTAPEYANTRKYSRRFSMARSMAVGQLVAQRFVSQGFRYAAADFNLCKDLAKMQKKLYEYNLRVLAADTTHDVGSQEYRSARWQKGIVDIVNQFSPNPLLASAVEGFRVQYRARINPTDGGGKIWFVMPIEFNNMLHSMGYDRCAVVLRYVCNSVHFNSQHQGSEVADTPKAEHLKESYEVMRWDFDTTTAFSVDGTSFFGKEGHPLSYLGNNICPYFVLQVVPYKGPQRSTTYQQSHNFYIAALGDELDGVNGGGSMVINPNPEIGQQDTTEE